MKHWFLKLLGKVEEEIAEAYTAAGRKMSVVVMVKMTRRKVAWVLFITFLIGFGAATAVWKVLL